MRNVVHDVVGSEAEHVDVSWLVRDGFWRADPLSAQTLKRIPATARRPLGVVEGTIETDGK